MKILAGLEPRDMAIEELRLLQQKVQQEAGSAEQAVQQDPCEVQAAPGQKKIPH